MRGGTVKRLSIGSRFPALNQQGYTLILGVFSLPYFVDWVLLEYKRKYEVPF